MNSKAVFAILVCMIGGCLAVAYKHYADSWKPKLRTDDTWLHVQPRFYEEEFAQSAGVVRDSVYQPAFPGSEVSVLTKTDPLLRSASLNGLVTSFESSIEEMLSPSNLGTCPDVQTPEVKWACLTWSKSHTEGTVIQRAYLTRRGHSSVVVLFSAVPDRVRQFGDPGRWLHELRWYGPGIAYAF